MTISFPNIPASGLWVPGFYADFDPSRAAYGSPVQRALLIGQTITAAPAVPTFVTTADNARATFGARSMLARMVAIYRANDPFGELWVMPLADASGVAATGTIAVTGPATATGEIDLYVGGVNVPVTVASGDAATAVATAIGAAINANPYLPVTASVSTSTVTVTAANKGTLGNSIDLRHGYLGAAGGEVLPGGIGLTITAMASGATDPALTGVDAALSDIEYDFIAHPYATATPLNAVQAMLGDTAGRWSYLRQTYGHAFTFAPGVASGLLTLGAARNDQHHSIFGLEGTPTPPSEIAAAVCGTIAVSVRADPARPVQTLAVQGVKAPPVASRWSKSTENSLLGSGIAVLAADADGTVRIRRAVTTYQRNPAGFTDRSYLDAETLYTLMAVVRRLRGAATSKFARSKLANDGTRFGAGQPIVTPSLYKAELVAEYAAMEADGLVEDTEGFIAATIVARNAADPSRLDVLFAPNLVNGLRVLALLVQFRS